MPSLKEKVALITGASSGIGEATALHFASLGCWLALTARNEAALQKVAEACRAKGVPPNKVLVVPGDVSVVADCANVVHKTAEHFGRIDILVNNAAVIGSGTTDSASLEDYSHVWNTNLRGPICLMQNALPHLRQTKGNVVNVSSVASMTVIYGATPYSLTKAALDHLTRCAALENARLGVRINCVNPGVIKTPIGKQPGTSDEQHFELLEKLTAGAHAMGRVGLPEEVARCIAFLASDDASFVTGITMPVDGGMVLMSSMAEDRLPAISTH